MLIKQPREFAQGLGIGAALMIAAGAISFFLRPSPADLASTSAPPANPAATTGELRTGTVSLPADYLDICRAAGL